MKYILAPLGFILGATTFSLLACEVAGSMSVTVAWLSLILGLLTAAVFYRACRKILRPFAKPGFFDYAIGLAFILFCFRFYGWLLYEHSGGFFTIDSNNFGDLPWHITSIQSLARSQKFWPENPILTGENFHYPFGIDLFGALFVKLGVPLQNLLPTTGFLCSLLFLATLYLWGGGFTIAGFLFSGGIAGYAIWGTETFRDYQADLAWKSLPLALYMTQRGFLYAFPAGLAVLWSWRQRFHLKKDGLPLWIEGLIWGTMPLFHVHTFILLSLVFAFWTLQSRKWKSSLTVLSIAFIPAAYEMARLTDFFHRASILSWNPGWMINFSHGKSLFWFDAIYFFFVNYGLFFPLTLMTLFIAVKTKKDRWDLVILPAAGIYVLCLFVKFAPWDWDNTKLMAWTYIMALPVIWELCVRPVKLVVKSSLLFCLFLSGFVCVYSVYENVMGYEIYHRETVDGVCHALENFPQDARIATAQAHNHPVLLCGHMVVAGYAGHLWSHGIPGHEVIENKLSRLMKGDDDWRQLSKEIQARYLFWGDEEERNFSGSKKPWVTQAKKVAEGTWGQMYDLGEDLK